MKMISQLFKRNIILLSTNVLKRFDEILLLYLSILLLNCKTSKKIGLWKLSFIPFWIDLSLNNLQLRLSNRDSDQLKKQLDVMM